MNNINWIQLRAKLKEAILVLPHFFKNPVQAKRTLPDWDWHTILCMQAALAAISAVLTNLLERDVIGIVTGFFLAPLASIVVLGVGAGFFYYTFLFFFKREIPYRQIYLHLVYAAIPVQLVQIAAVLIPPLILIGVAASMTLLFVGFNSNFHLERDKLRKLLIGLTLIYFAFWATQLISYTKKHDRMRLKATPESLDILEKELNFEE